MNKNIEIIYNFKTEVLLKKEYIEFLKINTYLYFYPILKLFNFDLKENDLVKYWIKYKRKEILEIQKKIDYNLWIFEERMDIKPNGEQGKLARDPCGFPGSMMNRNGTKDLSCMKMYRLNKKPKSILGHSKDNLKELQKSIDFASKVLNKFENKLKKHH